MPHRSFGSTHSFLHLRITFAATTLECLNAKLFKQMILEALLSMYGAMGSAAYDVDVLSFTPDDVASMSCGKGIIRVLKEHEVPVWGACTLLGRYADKSCRLEVVQASPCLAGLGCA
ncbi:unnamed protein product [Chrysoparadoxa australica]